MSMPLFDLLPVAKVGNGLVGHRVFSIGSGVTPGAWHVEAETAASPARIARLATALRERSSRVAAASS